MGVQLHKVQYTYVQCGSVEVYAFDQDEANRIVEKKLDESGLEEVERRHSHVTLHRNLETEKGEER